ncbi:hypothetical protein C1D09_014755 [Mesorhizobium intechi]|nr:hypothetical protein C1D09_014755 [Mesorhizobium intechi]
MFAPLLMSAKHANEGRARRAGSGRRAFRQLLAPLDAIEHQSNDALAPGIIAKYMAGIIGETELISLSRPTLSQIARGSHVAGIRNGNRLRSFYLSEVC